MSVAVSLSRLSSLSASLQPILGSRREVGASRICLEWRPKPQKRLPAVAPRTNRVVQSGWWDSSKGQGQEDTEWVLFRDGKAVQLDTSEQNAVERRKGLDVAKLISLDKSGANSHGNECDEPFTFRREDASTDTCGDVEEQLPSANERASWAVAESVNASAQAGTETTTTTTTATELPKSQEEDEGVDHPVASEAQVLDGVREDMSAAVEDEPPEVNEDLSRDARPPPQDPPSSSGLERHIAPTIELHYDTGWENAYLHFCVDSTRWTDDPGHLMDTASCEEEELPALKVIVVEGQSMEFVLNDGHGEWDRPADGRNYWIGHPGLYVLSCGNVKALSVLQPIELA